MLIGWLANKDLIDSESLIIRVAAVVLFAGTVVILDEVLVWNLSLQLLIGMSVIGGSVGFFVAKVFPIAIKAIPLVVFFVLASLASKEVYEHFYYKIVFIKPFLAETDNCKALGLELVNKHNFAACLSKNSRTIKHSCQHVIDNEWSCNAIDFRDIVAKPNWNSKASIAPEAL